MCIKRVFLLLLLIFFFPILSSAFSQNPKETKIKIDQQDQNNIEIAPLPLESELFLDEGDYYLSRGQKIPLRRDPRRIAVKFKNSVLSSLQKSSGRLTLQSNIVQQTLSIVSIDTPLTVERQLDKKGITILNAKSFSTSSPKLLRSQIQEIGAVDAVEYANPVYTSNRSINEIIPTDEILVRFTSEYGRAEVDAFCERYNLSLKRKTASRLNVYVLCVNGLNSRSTINVANSLNGRTGVVWSQPNFIQKLELNRVNDEFYTNQWHLENHGWSQGTEDADVDAEAAWDIQTGSPGITIAIIDDGVDLMHEDLAIWTNPNEIAGNGRDDDGNHYPDDTHGWDFYSDDNTPDADYANDHGTACAGVAAAKGNNNRGVAGIAYGCKILPVKIAGGSGGTFVDDAALGEAISYAARYADVISCSWGITGQIDLIKDEIKDAVENGRNGRGCPVFVAAGNSAAVNGMDFRQNFTLHSPGTLTVGWQYVKDGAEYYGGNAAWLDQVELEGETETFENDSFAELLDNGWSLEGDANWYPVQDSRHAIGARSVRSGDITRTQMSGIALSRYIADATATLSYRVWVDAGPDDLLYAVYQEGGRWVPYYYFVGKGLSFPASDENAIAVGASTNEDVLSSYSQYGDQLDFVAPSSGGSLGITTTDRTGSDGYSYTNYTNNFGGTSSAAPLAAGIAALLLSRNPNLTASEVKTIMQNSCEKIGTEQYDENGWNMYYGYGKVNAYNAIQQVEPAVESTNTNGDDGDSDRGGGGGNSGGCFISTLFQSIER